METDQNKETVLEKQIEAILGIFFLIPPILGVFSFVFNLLGGDGGFARMSNLSSEWSAIVAYAYDGGGGGGMSAAPIYLGLMAIVGTYLLKGNLRYLIRVNMHSLFEKIKTKKDGENKDEVKL